MLVPSLTKTYHHDVYHAIDPLRPELSITGKNVLVTGGGEGIGAAFTSTFAAAGAANLIILGRKAETLNAMKSKVEGNTAHKTKVHVFPADITDEKRINEVFEEVLRSIGAVDIYIANAGYLPNPRSIIDTSVEEFWRGFEINAKGAIVVAKAFLRSASANPILINITTVAACTRYSGPFGSYSGSKAGEARLMDTIAVECPHVRVYNVHPGLIETAMAKKSGMTVSPFDSVNLPAAFCLWLASPDGEFLRGRFLHANWDVDELKAMKEELLKNPDLLTMNILGAPFKHSTEIKIGAEV